MCRRKQTTLASILVLLMVTGFSPVSGFEQYFALVIFDKNTELVDIVEYRVETNTDLYRLYDTIGGDTLVMQKSAHNIVDVIDLSDYEGGSFEESQQTYLEIPVANTSYDILGVYDNKFIMLDMERFHDWEYYQHEEMKVTLYNPLDNTTEKSLKLNFTEIIDFDDVSSNNISLAAVDYAQDVLCFIIFEGTEEKAEMGEITMHLYRTDLDGMNTAAGKIYLDSTMHFSGLLHYGLDRSRFDLNQVGDHILVQTETDPRYATDGGMIFYDFENNQTIDIPFYIDPDTINEIELLGFNGNKLYFNSMTGNAELFGNFAVHLAEYDCDTGEYSRTEPKDISIFVHETLILDNYIILRSSNEDNFYTRSSTIGMEDFFSNMMLFGLAIAIANIINGSIRRKKESRYWDFDQIT